MQWVDSILPLSYISDGSLIAFAILESGEDYCDLSYLLMTAKKTKSDGANLQLNSADSTGPDNRIGPFNLCT